MKTLNTCYSIVFNCRTDTHTNVSISWKLRHSPCWQEYLGLENIVNFATNIFLSACNYA